MAVFTVHLPPAAAGAAPSPEKIVFLRDGFSWAAFFFGPFWLAWNRAWLAALAWTAALVAFVFLAARFGVSKESLSWVGLALGAAFGFEGSRLVAWTLVRRGFTESAVVIGDTFDEAEEVFFHDWRAAEAAKQTVAPQDASFGERRD